MEPFLDQVGSLDLYLQRTSLQVLSNKSLKYFNKVFENSCNSIFETLIEKN